MTLPPAHRIARYNYPARTTAFAFTFLVIGLFWIERSRFNVIEITVAVATFLVYPHLAYLHACYAVQSKRAELNNLYADCALLGLWAAQIHFALWPVVGMLGALCLNNAGHGHLRRLLRGIGLFAVASAAWGTLIGAEPVFTTGPLVTGACALGLLAYMSGVGVLVFEQNKILVRARDALRGSDAQFRFLADHVSEFVAVTDAQGRFVYASPSHTRHFDDRTVEEGASWSELSHGEDRDKARAFLDDILSSAKEQRIELTLALPNGATRTATCRGRPVRLGAGTSPLIVLISEFMRGPREA